MKFNWFTLIALSAASLIVLLLINNVDTVDSRLPAIIALGFVGTITSVLSLHFKE